MPGTLYLVATPIGNLQDITLRALEILRTVDLIACEDTRHTLKLLNHFRISNRLISYHEHNERERAEELVDRLVEGRSIAIVSDAGTPGINDPGYRIVERAIETGASVVPIPGAAAFVAAAVASGLPTDAMFFGGFLPSKKSDRRARLAEVASIPATLVFYEAPHRLAKSLTDCAEVLGPRQAAIARELTKVHEEFIRGDLVDLADKLSNIKGEIVLLIDRERDSQSPAVTNDLSPKTIADRIAELESSGLSQKAALKRLAKEMNLSKSAVYRLLIEAKQQ